MSQSHFVCRPGSPGVANRRVASQALLFYAVPICRWTLGEDLA